MYLLAAATISGQHPGFLHPDSPSGYTEGEGRVVQLFIQEWQEQSLFTEMAATAAKIHQSCLTLCDPIDGRPPGSRPWDSPGKNTGVGCHFLLQCMKVKSESEVAQLCLIPCHPMDCSLLGSSVHGIFQARVLEWGAIAFSTEMAGSIFFFWSETRWWLKMQILKPDGLGSNSISNTYWLC